MKLLTPWRGASPPRRDRAGRGARQRAATALCALLCAGLNGCWSYSPGDAHLPRAAPGVRADQLQWPPRDLAPVIDLMNRTPQVVRYTRPPDGVDPSSLSQSDRNALETRGVRVVYRGLHGLGLLRIYEPLATQEAADDQPSLGDLIDFMTLGFSPNAYWMTSRTIASSRDSGDRFIELPENEAEAPGILPPPYEDAQDSVLLQNEESADLYLHSGMAIRFPPAEVAAKPYVGVVLHLNAMFGNEYEVRTLDVFRRRGWAVIDLKPTSQVLPPIPQEWRDVIRASLSRRHELIARICTDLTGSPRYSARSAEDYERIVARFRGHPLASEVEHLNRIINRCHSGAYIASSPETYPEIAAKVADEFDQAQAGSAYACEAVLDYVARHRPDLASLPVALIGFSAGGLAAPTCAARVADKLSTVVIIGGGADCFTASQRSAFSNGGVSIRTTAQDPLEDRKLSPTQVRELSRLYLAASRLDPYHTAPLLADLPVLLVTGTDDTWVPSACGDLLWERLGRPDRLEINAGHELLFYFLPGKADFIADWVEKNVRAPGGRALPGYASEPGGQGDRSPPTGATSRQTTTLRVAP